MPFSRRAAAAALAMIGLAACAPLRSINYGMPYQPLTARSFLAWAGATGPVAVEVRDNPFQAPNQAVASALAEAATGVVAGVPVAFTGNTAEAARPEWRVVYEFNAAPSTSSAAVCNPNSRVDRASGESLTLLIVFCNDTKPIIAASIWSGPVAGPGAPEFRQLAETSMRDLFPPESMGSDSPAMEFPD